MKDYVLLLPVLFPAISALLTLVIKDKFKDRNFRTIYVGVVLLFTLVFNFYAIFNFRELTLFYLTKELPIRFRVDSLTYIFNSLVVIMWFLAGVFSFEYMKHEDNNESFYMFYLLTESVLIALGMSSNFTTLYLFYEFMTFLSLPLALHTRTKEAIDGGLKYLFYSVFGASLALVGFFFMNQYGNSLEFVAGGNLNLNKVMGHETLLRAVFFLTIFGFSVKAGMFPLHGWLTAAHPVAPAPASAVLSGVITKAGVLAIIRVIYYQAGVDFLKGTFVQYAFMILTLITVFMGSMMAYKEKVLKKRLAYSSVSQVSYVLFGLSTMTIIGFVGALLQVVFHSIAKNLLFMTAGSIIYKEHKTKVNELKGIGKNMPITMWCFTIGGLALVGIPPLTGFVSKWYLALGSLEANINVLSYVGPIVLLASALLTAGYLTTISIDAFLVGNDFNYQQVKKTEPNLYMVIPIVLLAVSCVLFGIFATPLINLFTDIAMTLM